MRLIKLALIFLSCVPAMSQTPISTSGNSYSIPPASFIALTYSTSGTPPAASSPTYSGAFPVTSPQTIRCIGVASGYNNSSLAGGLYNLVVATPSYNPSPGIITNGTAASITSATSGALIYFTVDGSTPTTSSTLYTGPITISTSPVVLQSIAAKSGFGNSAIQSGTYSFAPTSNCVYQRIWGFQGTQIGPCPQ
jgi:hypothetical protein